MWIDRPRHSNWNGGPVAPVDVLFEFEGPSIFISRVGFSDYIFLKQDEDEEVDFYLASPVYEEEIQALKNGRLSLHGAVSPSETFLIAVDSSWNVIEFQRWDYSDFKNILPKKGLGLSRKFGVVPDTLEQANAWVSFKFEGEAMSRKSMPLSTLKSLIDDVSEVARAVLMPGALSSGRNSRFFDLQVAPVRFSSLLIAIEEPKIDEGGLQRSKETKLLSVSNLMSEAEDKSAKFLDELNTATSLVGRGNGMSDDEVETHFEILDRIAHIIPTGRNDLSKLQISHYNGGRTQIVSIDKSLGDKLLAARASVEAPTRTIVGVVTEVNDSSRTFIIKDASDRHTTVAPGARYELMVENKMNRIGRVLLVKGKLWERARRDYMMLTADPVDKSQRL